MATIIGTQNADTLEGTTGDDTIDGRRGADTLIGMEGNDLYIFDRLDDSAVETEWGGTDTVRIAFANTGAAIDVDMRGANFANIENLEFSRTGLFNAIGNDLDNTITGNASVNLLSGGAGNDTLDGRAGADVMDGGEGDDTFYVENVSDVVVDSSGWDTVYAKVSWVMGAGIENLVLTGTGNFSGTGNTLDNYIEGNSGANTLSGGGGDDQLAGGAGNDTYIVTSNEGSDYTVILEEAGGGTDTVRTSTSYYALDANVEKLVQSEEAGDALGVGNELANVITGNSHHNTLSGGAGADTLEGGAGNDTYHVDIVTDGAQVLIEDKIKEQSGEGNDTLVLHGYIATGGATALTLSSNLENLDASDTGATRLDLFGNNAANTLTGNSADNAMSGKKGDDVLLGGDGNDAYRFAHGDGSDAIEDVSGVDQIIFTSSGIKPTNTTYMQVSYDLVIHYGTQGDVLRVTSFFMGGDTVEQVLFANGTVHDVAYISANLVPYSGAGDDRLVGTAYNDALEGLEGNDIISGRGGDDALYGGSGNDTLEGGEGNDLVDGGEGDDTYIFTQGSGMDILGDETGFNTVFFGAGISAESVAYYYAEYGGLSIFYGTGDAVNVGNFQYDPYRLDQVVFSDGTVHDTDFILSHMVAPLVTLTEDNDYFAGSGIPVNLTALAGDDLIYASEGDDTINGGTGSDSLNGGSGDDLYLLSEGDGIDQIEDLYGDDTISIAGGVNPDTATYTRLNTDLIIGYGASGDAVTLKYFFEKYAPINDRVIFGDGTVHDIDYINAHLVPALVTLTDGDDTYYGDSWDELVNGSVGNDWIAGDAGNDTLFGGSGDDFVAGDDGNDVMYGGTGDDTLQGWWGDDVYAFAAGDGADVIWDYDGIDTIVFAEGVAAGEGVYSRTFGDLVVSYGSGDTVTVQYFFTDPQLMIENISFADGTFHDATYIQAHLANGGLISLSENDDVYHSGQGSISVAGLGGNDVIYGHGDNNILSGNAGDDQLFGYGADNVLTGGAGNDALFGGENDIYAFSEGDGIDRIEDVSGDDAIRFDVDVDSATVYYMQDGSDLMVYYGGTGGEIRVSNYFADNAYEIEQVIFDDGTAHDSAYISANIYSPPFGTEGDDILVGSVGNNYIEGYEGNDTIIGGKGDDTLIGGHGDDVYLFASGDGADLIDPYYSGNDMISFAAGIDPTAVSYYKSNDDLTIEYGPGDAIFIPYFFQGGEIQSVAFADSTVHDVSHIFAHATPAKIVLSENADFYDGTSGDDTIDGRGGNDIIDGHDGNDTLSGGAGDDELFGNSGNDCIAGGDGNDSLYGMEGNDTFLFDQNAYYGVDSIADFDGGVDRIDISQLLTGYDPLTMVLADFVSVGESSGETILSIDADGAGAGNVMVQIATLSGVTGLGTADDMVAAGQLVVSV